MAKKDKNNREAEGDTKPDADTMLDADGSADGGDARTLDGSAPAAAVAPAAGIAPITYTVRVPFSRFEGERGGVHFRQGVGTTDNPAVAADLASLGYTVEPTPVVAVAADEPTA